MWRPAAAVSYGSRHVPRPSPVVRPVGGAGPEGFVPVGSLSFMSSRTATRPHRFPMASPTTARRMIILAWALAAVAALLAILDLALPEGAKLFGGQMVMDVLFLVSAALVGYLGWDAWRDVR